MRFPKYFLKMFFILITTFSILNTSILIEANKDDFSKPTYSKIRV